MSRRRKAFPRSWPARRFTTRQWVRAVVLLVAVIVLLLARLQIWPLPEQPRQPENIVQVQRVVDGDTLLLTNGDRIRLLGVDTPETKHPNRPPEPLGQEAYQFTRHHVEGRTIRLEFDRERRDRYGRILAYVYLDQWFLNEELIRAGLSRAETRYRFSESMKRRFRAAEQEARQRNLGLWSAKARGRP